MKNSYKKIKILYFNYSIFITFCQYFLNKNHFEISYYEILIKIVLIALLFLFSNVSEYRKNRVDKRF